MPRRLETLPGGDALRDNGEKEDAIEDRASRKVSRRCEGEGGMRRRRETWFPPRAFADAAMRRRNAPSPLRTNFALGYRNRHPFFCFPFVPLFINIRVTILCRLESLPPHKQPPVRRSSLSSGK